MKKKTLTFTVEQLADICLSADGGYCFSCATDVADAIGDEDVKKLVEEKYDAYYKREE